MEGLQGWDGGVDGVGYEADLLLRWPSTFLLPRLPNRPTLLKPIILPTVKPPPLEHANPPNAHSRRALHNRQHRPDKHLLNRIPRIVGIAEGGDKSEEIGGEDVQVLGELAGWEVLEVCCC